jgi:hypothetical protein
LELTFFTYRGKVFLSSLLAAVILLLAVFLGASAGKQLATSETIIQTAQNLSAGAQYFYNDQNRYPTASEFADQNTMLNYFNVFPPQNFVSKNCSQSFVYKRTDDSNFSLSFCLPGAFGAYQSGWNTISGSPQ